MSPMKNLYTPEVHEELVARIGRLRPEMTPLWGRMTVAQMLAHCSEVIEVSLGKRLDNTPFIAKLFGGMIKRMILSDRPYPRGSRTHPQYRVTDNRDFETEIRRLQENIRRFTWEDRQAAESHEHALFGRMTVDERGRAMFKHLDHHLTQFGV